MTANATSDEPVRVSRSLRTPITVAGEAIGLACDFWIWLSDRAGTPADPQNYFFENFFGKAFNNPETNGDQAVGEIGTLLDGTYAADGSAPFALFQVMVVVIDYSVQAMKAEINGDHQMAWSFACDAQYWAGCLGASHARKKEPNPITTNAVNAAVARWKKDPKSAEKQFIHGCWLDWRKTPSRYKSKAAFALDMIGKCEYLTSTKKIEDWCREWEKQES